VAPRAVRLLRSLLLLSRGKRGHFVFGVMHMIRVGFKQHLGPVQYFFSYTFSTPHSLITVFFFKNRHAVTFPDAVLEGEESCGWRAELCPCSCAVSARGEHRFPAQDQEDSLRAGVSS